MLVTSPLQSAPACLALQRPAAAGTPWRGWLLSWLLTWPLASGAVTDQGVDIEDSAQVTALTQLQGTIDDLSDRVMSCIDGGASHQACLCDNRDGLDRFRRRLERVLDGHPGLQELDLVRFRDPEGMLVSQSLEGIRRQAALQVNCQ